MARKIRVTKSKSIPCEDNKTTKKNCEKVDPSDRGGWWKNTIKDTPIPGTYHIRDFIEEAGLNPIHRTYCFRALGRNAPLQHSRKGDMLLPGAYSFTDSTQKALQHQAYYSFKNCPRPDNYTLGVRDKDIDLSPCHYDVTEKPVPKLPCKHMTFRSAVQRFSFPPREGPAPGQYNLKDSSSKSITSCFKSAVPRFYNVQSRTPGPGMYEPWLKSYYLDTEVELNRTYGLLFRNYF
ncbi:protein STPG4 [Chanos chanos]|uniref:Protein STPG4 n=1 Tax=Chanos chanos TaxID=29144 RepID=A0A6J2V5K2_CHACN|nr:protein STPG4 [Chanos chanos]